MIYHKDIANLLSKYSTSTTPHLIIHGGHGYGKKTIVNAFIHHLYKKSPEPRLKITTILNSSKKPMEISYYESDEFIQISPSEYNYQDKTVIQTIIKEMVRSKPILSMFGNKKEQVIKFIMITDGDKLSRDAQAALRRTMETYSSNFRLILICNELSGLIEPIRSRCLCVRIPGFTDFEIEKRLKEILHIENKFLDKEAIDNIVISSAGNMRRAIVALENLCFKIQDRSNKRIKTQVYDFRMEWELTIDGIIKMMQYEQNCDTIMKVRNELYILLNSCIPADIILIELVRKLLKTSSKDTFMKISESAAIYDERLKIGSKSILHLEGFVATILNILNDEKYN
ncbi:Replication factor C subunit 3 [Astathelohania contejeani]|uniref:Replication factor C subunit 3 n=1 Tax=Astathelohania contejeani TaxID=164912 RepID=A0ABQ7I2F9_9MICR|nr:Replication factor C subunit 3 [Thelohania contejeani]